MKWLAPQWIGAFVFALIPILIHLWKKTSAKKIILGSLYLLHRKDPNFHKNLKLHQLLLLITRVLLVVFVVTYFLKTISNGSMGIMSQYFPYHEKTKVLLDTTWDSKKDLTAIFTDKYPKIQSPKFEVINFKELNSRRLNENERFYLLSRFYGKSKLDLDKLYKKGLILFPIGKEKLKNTRLNSISVEPKNPFIGEFVDISSSLVSNESGKLHEIELKVEGKTSLKQTLSQSKSVKRNFSFRVKAQGDFFLAGKLQIKKDEYNKDNQQLFKIPLRRKIKVALIEDLIDIQQKNSKLHYIYQFLTSILQNSPQFNIDFKVMNSSQWNNSIVDDFDWLIVGELQNKVWKKKNERMIVFAQRGQIQNFYNEKFAMKTFNLDSSPKLIQFLNISSFDRALISSSFKSYKHLQIKMTKGRAILKSNSEVLAIEYKKDYFFSFDFTKGGFSGVLHPYFPIYLYRLILDRWESESKNLDEEQFKFSRDNSYFQNEKFKEFKSQRVDFSTLILFLILSLVLLELYFILSIEKQKI